MAIQTSNAQIRSLRNKVNNGEILSEQVLTFLVASILDGRIDNGNREQIIKLFLPRVRRRINTVEPWYEALPLPPRKSEGNTNLDLAFGAIKRRRNTISGIQYSFPDKDEDKWVCFVEAKFLSDCDDETKHDPFRNQITRVIENLLCFQDDNEKFPDKLFFTLLTPKKIRDKHDAWRTRLYGYKFKEYKTEEGFNAPLLIRDINMQKAQRRDTNDWRYPNIVERIQYLRLKWIAYEEIFELAYGDEFGNIDLIDVLYGTPTNKGEVSENLKNISQIVDILNEYE